MVEQVEIVAVFSGVRWRSDKTDWLIGTVEYDSRPLTICGNSPQGVLIPEVQYKFTGAWETHSKYGRQFKFVAAVQLEPHSRMGVVNYLQKYAPNVGYAIAGQLWNAFGVEAVKVLRTEPAKASEACKGFSLTKAMAAARELEKLAALEDVRIDLGNLFTQAKIPLTCVEYCIAKWHLNAFEVVRRDPFKLLTAGVKLCGFTRCDTLYKILRLRPGKLKRQTICLWYVLQEQANGSTWLQLSTCREAVAGLVPAAELDIDKAIKLGVRARWLAVRQVGPTWWIAQAEKASSEIRLAESILQLTRNCVPVLKAVQSA